MRETGKHYIAIIVALLIFLPVISSGTEDTYKIAYIEGDPYVNYAGTLYGLAMGLSDQQRDALVNLSPTDFSE